MKKSNIPNNFKPLILDDIPKLIGEQIEIMYFTKNGVEYDSIKVGGIETQYNLASKEIMDNGYTRASMYDRTCTPKQLERFKTKYCLLDDKGNNTFIFAYANKGIFYCQDFLKQVFYVLC